MDFFRRIFPRTLKEHLVQGINDELPLKTTKIFIDQPSRSSVNLNELDAMSTKDLPTTETNLAHDITQKNVTPTEIRLNPNEHTLIDDLKDFLRDDIILNNTNINDDVSMKDETLDVISNKESEVVNIKNNVACKNCKETGLAISREIKDDDTVKNIKEFEDTLKEFERKKCCDVNCGHEIIDLDEFEEFVGQLDCDDTTNINVPKVEAMDGVIDDLSNSKLSLNNLENVDVISIVSSTDDAKSQIISTQDLPYTSSGTQSDDYNSSDFEFITEEEANMDGFIINFNRESQDFETSSLSSSEPLSTYVFNKKEIGSSENIDTQKAFIDPGAGPSGLNKPKNEFEDRSYRNNHVLPEGDEYLGLFRGIYNPLMPVCEIIFLENKSVRASPMNIQYDGIGFDKQLMHKKYKQDSSEDEFEDEARNCAQKILTMYPGENRKRRRRF